MTAFSFIIGLGAFGLVVSALSSLAETSFMSLSRLQLARLEKVRPGRLAFWIKDPDRSLAVILLVNNMVNVGIGFLATAAALEAEVRWGLPFPWGDLLFPAAAAAAVIVLAEIIPKVAARLASERIALALAPVLSGATRFFGPLVRGLVDGTGKFVERLSSRVKAEGSWDPHVIRQMLETTSLSRATRSVVTGLLDFDRRLLVGVMVPREEIFSVDLSLPRAEVMRRTAASGYSRVPVHRGSLDGAMGVLYAKDLLAAARESELIVLEDLIRPVPRVPMETPLSDILRRFREGRFHLAFVVDRSDRVRGLVTLQDLLEAIVGPVAEEQPLPRR
jgi:CBS domain containing-hemolysin-like protein